MKTAEKIKNNLNWSRTFTARRTLNSSAYFRDPLCSPFLTKNGTKPISSLLASFACHGGFCSGFESSFRRCCDYNFIICYKIYRNDRLLPQTPKRLKDCFSSGYLLCKIIDSASTKAFIDMTDRHWMSPTKFRYVRLFPLLILRIVGTHPVNWNSEKLSESTHIGLHASILSDVLLLENVA